MQKLHGLLHVPCNIESEGSRIIFRGSDPGGLETEGLTPPAK